MYQRILVAIDDSHCARAALAEAIHLAASCKAELEITHVIDYGFLQHELGQGELSTRRPQLAAAGNTLVPGGGHRQGGRCAVHHDARRRDVRAGGYRQRGAQDRCHGRRADHRRRHPRTSWDSAPACWQRGRKPGTRVFRARAACARTDSAGRRRLRPCPGGHGSRNLAATWPTTIAWSMCLRPRARRTRRCRKIKGASRGAPSRPGKRRRGP